MRLGLQSLFYKNAWHPNDRYRGKTDTNSKERVIYSGRRDSSALQAIVWDEDAFLLTLSKETVFWKGGALPIGRLEVTLDAPFPVEVKLVGRVGDNLHTPTSDVLLEQKTIYVTKQRLQQVWIECHVPVEAMSGTYTGTVKLYTHTMFEDERLEDEARFTLIVKDVVLPEARDYRFYLDLWQHSSNIARQYQIDLWSDEHFTLLERYLAVLSRLGQKVATLIVSEIPWSGQGSFHDWEPADFYEYSMIGVTRKRDGSFQYDFSALDRYVALAERYGMAQELEVFGLLNIWQMPEDGYGAIVEGYPDGIRVRYYDEASGIYRFIREYEALAAYIRAIEAHFVERGWTERARILADEPADVAEFTKRWKSLKQLAPSFRMKVAINHVEFLQQQIPDMYDAVPALNYAALEYHQLMEARAQLPGKILYYVCCSQPHPNTFIHSPAFEARVTPWLVERLKLDGFLRWSFTCWTDRPLEDVYTRGGNWPAGDTHLVYPGAQGWPMLSLRYKWLQRGIRDYELLQMAKEAGREAWVEELINGVFRFTDPTEIKMEVSATKFYSDNLEDYERLIREW